ncbi:MAG: TonB-dependent receptor [Hyphomonadaceae bacterium]|nr:TonB-dependent receptor [Hyphomonadaceae bacterium]
MKFTLRSASSAALIAGLAGVALPVWAQESTAAGPQAQVDQVAPQTAPPEDEEGQRVIVTGSFIAGTSEAAALPVEVYSAAELEEQGAPTALEFAKSLTIAGPTTGEAYYFSGAALTGSVNYNLRGLGADKTLTLLNGRRGSENTSNIPSAALSRTEVLKDGAAVIYGADATGGVVNFITRDDFTGLEAKANYKYIDGSDGDYGLSLLGGIGEGDTNFMWSVEWEHRSRLETEDRDFAVVSHDFTVNPAPWSTLTNLAGWTARGALPATPTLANEFGTALSAPLSDFTPASCAAVGGFYTNTFTCNYNYISYYNLVEENDIFRGYAQLNTSISDNMDFHFEASYGQVLTPQAFGSPAQPVIRGPAMATGAVNQFYVPITNPFAAAFAARVGAPGAAQGFTPTTYRAFAHGGNPVFGDGNGYGVPSKIDNQVWRVSSGIKGTFGDWAGIFSDVGYDAAVTYNQSISYADAADVLGFRLQEALNGFGGPGCNVPDLDPARFGTQNAPLAGKGACQWWNPFATNFPNQPERGLANPQYVAGQENSIELARWLFDDRAAEDINSSLTADLVFNGMSGINLPGGEIGWALGGQVRQLELREVVNSPLYNGNLQCDWPASTTGGSPAVPQTPRPTNDPLFRGCTPDNPGPFVFFGINPPDYNDQQQYSVFGEAQIPLLDNLNFQAAVRREEFSGGLGATVYKVSGKWDVFGPLSLRGSYGTNYQAPPIGVIPGEVVNAVRSYTVAGGNWVGAQFITDTSLVPETATSWNVGAIWQSQGFGPDHDLRIIVDYFNIETEDEIGQLADPNQIARLVFNGGAASNGVITTCDPAVQPLLNRVTFNSPCFVGMTAVGNFASISTVFGNGPGQTTNGIDYQITYDMPIGPGDLTLGVTATQVTELLTGPTSLDGVVISTGDDRLGTLNFATVASAAPEWRTNFSANYNMERHNFRFGANYVSAVTDERAGIQYGENGEEWLTYDFTYLFDITDTLRLTASVNNITDEDPPAAQEELGYDPRLGNPLGRTFEIGIKKTF